MAAITRVPPHSQQNRLSFSVTRREAEQWWAV
jgi:hypothetical protein